MPIFTWIPDYGLDETTEPAVVEARFGDGYSMRAPDGINNMLRKWPLQFTNASESMTLDIVAFLKERAGYKSFTWTIPETSETVTVLCRSWGKNYSGYKSYTVRATFEEIPG